MKPSSPSASSLWRNANFVRLFAAQIVSLSGNENAKSASPIEHGRAGALFVRGTRVTAAVAPNCGRYVQAARKLIASGRDITSIARAIKPCR